MRVFYLLVLILLPALLPGQNAASYEVLKVQYPKTPKVILKNERVIDITVQADSLNITMDNYEEEMYLNEMASSYADQSVGFSNFFEVTEIKAKSFLPSSDGKKGRKVKDFDIQETISDQFFYDDQSTIKFRFDDLREGGKTQLSYSQHVKNDLFIPGAYFGSWVPVLDSKLKVVADKGVEIRFLEFNMDGVKFDRQEKQVGGRMQYTYHFKNMEPIDLESGGPSFQKVVPHVQMTVKSYQKNGQEEVVLKGPKDLFRWYSSLIDEMDITGDDFMQDLVDSLTVGITSERDKVESVFQWVQGNINYIAFEDNMGGFIPRNPKQVCEKRYGDCKDMSSVIVKLLNLAGIEGNYTWVGTRDLPYKYSDHAGVFVDNHMIATYRDKEADKIYFLDATDEYLPFGYPSNFIQGKQVMIYKSKDEYEIVDVPVVSCDRSGLQETAELTIVDNLLKAETTLDFYGFSARNHYSVEKNIQENKRDKANNSLYGKGNNKCTVSNVVAKITEPDHVQLDMNFELPDYVNVTNDKILINMNLEKVLAKMIIDKDRKYAMELENAFNFKREYHLKIPEGYEVEFMPESVNESTEEVNFSIDYELKNQTVVYNLDVCFDAISIEPQSFVAHRDFIKKIKKAYRENVVLQKK